MTEKWRDQRRDGEREREIEMESGAGRERELADWVDGPALTVRVVKHHVVVEARRARGGQLEDFEGARGRDDRVRRSHRRDDVFNNPLGEPVRDSEDPCSTQTHTHNVDIECVTQDRREFDHGRID